MSGYDPTREPSNEELRYNTYSTAHQQVAVPMPPQHAMMPAPGTGRGQQLALAIVTIVMAIPLTAIGYHYMNMYGALLAWVGLVAINAIFRGPSRPKQP